MKKIVKLLLLTTVSVLLLAGSSMAIPSNLKDITGIAGTEKYTDSGAEIFKLTDNDGVNDDATAFLLFEFAGFKDTNSFGIYGFNKDINGNVIVGNTLEIFKGTDSAIKSRTLKFNVALNTVTLGTQTTTIDDTSFGFYIQTTGEGTTHTYYTQKDLNVGKLDYAMVFDTSDNSVDDLWGSDVVIGFEDLNGLGDKDYDDMVVGISDVAPVPEPATMFLLGTGIIGLAGARKKRAKK